MKCGLPIEICYFILNLVGITYCVKHDTYYPQCLKSCLLCFDQTTSDFTSPNRWLFYKPQEKARVYSNGAITFHTKDALFQKHFMQFCRVRNPNYEAMIGTQTNVSIIGVSNLKLENQITCSSIVILSNQDKLIENWSCFNIKRYFLDTDNVVLLSKKSLKF
jgi:hypothetical protein